MKDKRTMRERIMNIVNTRGAITGKDLALTLMGEHQPTQFDQDGFHHELQLLVYEGEILEIEYFEKENPQITRLILFKKGTSFVFGGDNDRSSKVNLDRQSERDS